MELVGVFIKLSYLGIRGFTVSVAEIILALTLHAASKNLCGYGPCFGNLAAFPSIPLALI